MCKEWLPTSNFCVQDVVMAGKKLELGKTGRTVADNVARLKKAAGLNFTELSKRLAELGRDIPPLAVRRIEEGQRRVDVDDLMALAVALEISPETLLMPYAENADDEVEITGWHAMAALEAWRWMQVDTSSGWRQFPRLSAERALPAFVYRKRMEDTAARMPEMIAKFKKRQREYGLSDGND